MKRLIPLIILSFCFGMNSLFAQCSIDNTITQPGYYPSCSIGLPHDTVGQAYSTVLQVRVLTDTNVVIFGSSQHATIDSVVLNDVKGLPSGFSFVTNPATRSFPGGSN